MTQKEEKIILHLTNGEKWKFSLLHLCRKSEDVWVCHKRKHTYEIQFPPGWYSRSRVVITCVSGPQRRVLFGTVEGDATVRIGADRLVMENCEVRFL